MASILDFTINYRSDEEQVIKKLNNIEPQIKKTCLIYILVVIFFIVHMKVNFAAIIDFFI